MPSPLDFAMPASRQGWCQRLLAPIDEVAWGDLCQQLFAYQYARVPAFRRLARGHGVSPRNLCFWRDIPGMPQQVFKRERLYCAGLPHPSATYETSGTTTGQPGRQHLLSPDVYRSASVAGVERLGLLEAAKFLHFLTPSPEEAPHSSLSAMFGFWKYQHGGKRGEFWVRGNEIDLVGLRAALIAQSKKGKPIGLAGTAFSFVHVIDAWADLPPLRLPQGSWLLETGGFKGRSREVTKADLYAQLARTFGLRDSYLYNEYGMSELSSQAYTRGSRGIHATPPWARVLVVDPATGGEVRIGQRGLVRWYDLANIDSVFALQTLDLAVRTVAGFKLLGRMARTEPRGCSLSSDDLLARSTPAL